MILIPFLILYSQLANTQVHQETDSAKVSKNHSAFEKLIHVNEDSARLHLNTLKQLALDLDYPLAKFLYPYDLGYYLFTQRKLDSSNYYYQKSLDIANRYELKKEAIQAKIWVSNHFYFKNQKENAKKLLNEVLAESSELNYVDGMANAYFGLSKFENDAEKILLLHLKIVLTQNK